MVHFLALAHPFQTHMWPCSVVTNVSSVRVNSRQRRSGATLQECHSSHYTCKNKSLSHSRALFTLKPSTGSYSAFAYWLLECPCVDGEVHWILL